MTITRRGVMWEPELEEEYNQHKAVAFGKVLTVYSDRYGEDWAFSVDGEFVADHMHSMEKAMDDAIETARDDE